MKSFFRNLSSRFSFLANRPSALERAVRQSPKSRRLRMEPLENRALLAVDAFGGAASLVGSDVGESWGSDPAPAFSASELSTDAAETTISLAALNSVPYGPYVTSEQAALIALRSNATLADETLADFGALWDETDETTFAETATNGETLNVVAEALTFEPLDLGGIEQDPLPGDASVMSGSNGNSGDDGNPDDPENNVSVALSGGNIYYGPYETDADYTVMEFLGGLDFDIWGPDNAIITASVDSEHTIDFKDAQKNILLSGGYGQVSFETLDDMRYEDDEEATITFKLDGDTVATYTVGILNSPEFISGGDSEKQNNKIVDVDEQKVGFDSTQISTNPIYTPQIHAQPGRDLTYAYTGVGWAPVSMGDDGLVQADLSKLSENNRKYGLGTWTINAAYKDDPRFWDEITLSVAWADVGQARNDLTAVYNEFLSRDDLSGLTPAQRAAELMEDLQFFASYSGNNESKNNAFYAIREIAACPEAPATPSAVKVTYCDGSEQTFALYPNAQE